MKINLGDKFYKVLEDEKVEIIRVIKVKSNSIIVVNEKKEKISMTEADLGDWTKLTPDAYITFSIVTLEMNMKDVIVSIHRKKDLEEGIELPYAACRQNILDIFANQVIKDDTYYIGCSLSQDTCPPDVDYRVIVACNDINRMYMVSAYIDDTLDDWFEIIPYKKFDEVLGNIYGSIGNANLDGYSKTLRELLEVNCFMYDFHKGFNIDEVPFEVKYDPITLELESTQVRYLEDLYKNEMFRTYVIPYTKEISLSKIQRYYVLISDTANKLYIVAYDRGEYINRIYQQQIRDKRDAVALLKYKINKQ